MTPCKQVYQGGDWLFWAVAHNSLSFYCVEIELHYIAILHCNFFGWVVRCCCIDYVLLKLLANGFAEFMKLDIWSVLIWKLRTLFDIDRIDIKNAWIQMSFQ